MCSRIHKELAAALRQYRHNDGTPGFVFAYETRAVDRLITDLQARIDRLSEAIARRDGLLKRAEAENTIEWQAQRSAVQRPDGTIVTADDAPHTPEQADTSYTLERALHIARNPYGWSEDYVRCARCYVCDEVERLQRELEECRTRNRQIRHVAGLDPQDAHPTPEQAHGDALTALEDLVLKAGKEACGEEYSIVRRHLTASGVPEDRESAIWLVAEIMDKFMPKPPGPPDSPFEFQPKFARNALYRQAERAIDNAGESGSGVPYVSEEVRRIIHRLRFDRPGFQSIDTFCEWVADELERALASAPADGWRSMDSAPKDGTRILVYCPTTWGDQDEYHVAAYNERTDGGWEVRTDDSPNMSMSFKTKNPAAWMSIAAPPQRGK